MNAKEFGTTLWMMAEGHVGMASAPAGDGCAPGASSASEIDRSVARYLHAILARSATGDPRVSTGELSDELGVTPASVTEMVSRLDDRGLIDHEPYRGACLTDRGRTLAVEVARRCCVVSSFFESTVNAAIDERSALDIGIELPEDAVSRLHDLVEGPCLALCPAADGPSGGCVA